MTNKSSRNGGNIILQENDEIIVDSKQVSDIFNDYFVGIASTIGFEDEITDTSAAIHKHQDHPSVIKIRGKFGSLSDSFTFKSVNPDLIFKKLKSINIRKAVTTYPGNYSVWHTLNYANPVYGVATICHQVRWLRWGHPSLFHIATSQFIWYKMFCMRDISYRLTWMKYINMLSVYAQSETHRRFNWWIIAVLT